MYRDTVTALDEHDRAVGAILVGEALIDACDVATVRSKSAENEAERWRAMAEVADTYPEIWISLDRARRVLAARGMNTAKYDELRPSSRRAPTRDDGQALDPSALEGAKRAIAELKLAVPGADWDAIHARTEGLINAPLARRRQRWAIAGVLVVFGLALVTWMSAIVPHKKPDVRAEMRAELQQIREDRKLRIDTLFLEIGPRCDPPRVHELMKLLVLDGRGADATAFADGYFERCGEDQVVEHWANAPRAPTPR